MLVSPIGSFITKAVCPRADWRGLGRSSADAIVCICLGERLRKLKEDIPTTRRSRGLETAHTNERRPFFSVIYWPRSLVVVVVYSWEVRGWYYIERVSGSNTNITFSSFLIRFYIHKRIIITARRLGYLFTTSSLMAFSLFRFFFYLIIEFFFFFYSGTCIKKKKGSRKKIFPPSYNNFLLQQQLAGPTVIDMGNKRMAEMVVGGWTSSRKKRILGYYILIRL